MPPVTTNVEAPITGVVVYTTNARITRAGKVNITPGAHELVVRDLPAAIVENSVRVAGRGNARVVGVDIAKRFLASAPDDRVSELEERLRALRHQDRELLDAAATERVRRRFVRRLATLGGREYATSLATGEVAPEAVTAFGDLVGREYRLSLSRDLAFVDERDELDRKIAALEAELQHVRQQAATERRDVVVSVEADAKATIHLELSYLVTNASWQPGYDCRVEGQRVMLAVHGLIRQKSGEDWPAAAVSLSTARPPVSRTISELDPWYVGVRDYQPISRSFSFASAPAPHRRSRSAGAEDEPELAEMEASPEQGPTAVTWKLARPIAVSSDGAAHKAPITTVDLEATLDYFCAPRAADEAYLRATVTNTSPTALLPGRVSVFHDTDFVGTTEIESVAPGEEFELQLGVDDRVTVERKLSRRQTSRNMLGNLRRTAVTYTTEIVNRLPDPIRLTVQDQFPISTHERVRVDDKTAEPEPLERTDLDILTWKFEVSAGAKVTLHLSFQLEHPRDVTISGFAD